MLTDTHCHLDFPDYNEDLEEVIARASEAGVTRMISIGTSLASSRRAVAIAEKHPGIFATVGVHPCDHDSWEETQFDAFAELCRHPKVVAIGECGLDYHHLPNIDEFPSAEAHATEIVRIKSHQHHVFQRQLELAAEQGLNVVIHQRNSWDDCLAALQPWHGILRTVFHCFGESTERARTLTDLGHLVSFTGIVTFKKSNDLRETVAAIPEDGFMIETDAPYLAPVPHRGKRCEPSMVAETAKTIATARGMTLNELADRTNQTANRFFRFP